MTEKIKVKFEMGNINPRGLEFDHHGDVRHRDAFIAKMASVQLLEWLLMTGTNPEALELEMNHVGHLDDMVAHAIAPAGRAGKLRSLYRFATTVSILDSCGPSGYKLIQRADKAIVDTVYARYHEAWSALAEKAGVQKWNVPLADKIRASKAAGELLVSLLPEDDYEEAIPWVPEDGTYRIAGEKDGVVLVEGLSDKFNPLRASAFFYGQGYKAVVGFKKHATALWEFDYEACVRSNYDADLSGLWPRLATEEKIPAGERNWGGHAGAGGSPRKNEKTGFEGGSVRQPEDILALVSECV